MLTRLMLIITMGLFLTACGGGGSGGNNAAVEKMKITGQVGFEPIADVEVKLFTSHGAEIARSISDINGQYLFTEIPYQPGEKFNLSASFIISGVELKFIANVASASKEITANITPVTTLMYELQSLTGKSESQLVSTLSGIGAIGTDWRSVSPSIINVEGFQALLNEPYMGETLKEIAADLSDNDVSIENLGLFPEAHGGIIQISVGVDDRLILLEGTKTQALIEVDAFTNVSELIVTTTDESPATIIKKGGQWYVVYDASQESGPLNRHIPITVTNSSTNKSRTLNAFVDIVPSENLASGLITNQGGELISEDGQVGVEIPAGQLSNPVNVQLIRGKAPDGSELINLTSDDVNDTPVEILLHWFPEDIPTDSRDTKQTRSSEKEPSCEAGYIESNWARYHGFYKDNDSVRHDTKGSDLQITTGGMLVGRTHRIASLLCGSVPIDKDSTWWQNHDPVLFVHGYSILNSLGGGRKTWGEFPLLVRQLNQGDYGFTPFEFRWRTNARFQTVANDLAKAIHEIHNITGKKVHIVAHSMGGVLVRSMLQQIPGAPISKHSVAPGVEHNVTKMVASVVTLGTPHSGLRTKKGEIADGNLEQTFPIGYDSKSPSGVLCRQISCYQLGDDFPVLSHEPKWHTNRNVWTDPGWVALQMQQTSWPDDVPVMVGIGLTINSLGISLVKGDNLISYAGQRFKNNNDGENEHSLMLSENINEKIIGALALDGFPGRPGDLSPRTGYSHAKWMNSLNARFTGHYEAHIKKGQCEINMVGGCGHGAFDLVRNMLLDNINSTLPQLEDIALQKPDHLVAYTFNNKAHLSWGIVPYAESYNVSISTDKSFVTGVETFQVMGSNYLYTIPPDGRVRYFRVIAVNTWGASMVSDAQVIRNEKGIISGRITDSETGELISGAVISFNIDGYEHSVESNENGYYILRVPSAFSTALIRIAADGYIHGSIEFTRNEISLNKFLEKDVSLKRVGHNTVLVEGGDSAYHLGNDLFSGMINSSFQSGAIGTEITLLFTLTNDQLTSYSKAVLRLKAKGVQATLKPNYFYVNGTKLGSLPNSPADGSYGDYSFMYDFGVIGLLSGTNTIKFESAYVNSFDPYDDFEIADIYIELE